MILYVSSDVYGLQAALDSPWSRIYRKQSRILSSRCGHVLGASDGHI